MRFLNWKVVMSLCSMLLMSGLVYNFHLKKPYKESSVLKVSLPPDWGALIPGQQHSFIAGLILSHEFESLVKINAKGLIVPGIAESWSISKDFREYTFKIDRKKKFSNGKPVIAQDVKDSWERGLKMEAKSSNHSMADVMYLVEGYEDFERTKTISGVEVLSEDLLRIRFKKPFRLALDHFSGVRYSLNLPAEASDEIIGTGQFRIVRKSSDEVQMQRNEHSRSDDSPVQSIFIKAQEPTAAIQSLIDGETDLALLNPFSNISLLESHRDQLEIYEGQESGHLILSLNGLSGRLFSDERLRLALQYLVASEIKGNPEFESEVAPGLVVDHQSYLPAQAGRLDKSEVDLLVQKGEEYLPLLKRSTVNKPLLLATGKSGEWFKKILKKHDIPYEEILDSSKDFWRMYFKTFEPDVTVGAFGVIHGDPDGLYHALGPTGSIASRMIQREKVMSLLEEGRTVVDPKLVHGHYQKVSRAILNEVPYVHVGFHRRLFVFKKGSIRIRDEILHRRNMDLTNFIPIEQK